MTAIEVLDRLAALGCEVRVEGEKLKVRGPDRPEIAGLVSELRLNRDSALEFLRNQLSEPPNLEEITKLLPSGVRVVAYEPRQAPIAIAPVSVVTDAGKFFRRYLSDLGWRLEHPDGYAAPSLPDILSKLGAAGLELTVEISNGDQNVQLT